jgi:deoxyribose-phosphate aldolase
MASSQPELLPAELAKHIDHTLLKPTATPSDFLRLFEEARRHGFWSVCVPPSEVKLAAAHMKGSGVRVCTVVGFPLGFSSSRSKREEARLAMDEGADEIDMVMNIGAFKGGDFDTVSGEIRDVSSDCRGVHKVLKVIIECCYLTNEEKVKAARIAESMGADYVKTSTGFGPSGATVEDVTLLRRSLALTTKIKAAGGIGTLAKALDMIRAGADRIGTSSGVAIIEEAARLGRGA